MIPKAGLVVDLVGIAGREIHRLCWMSEHLTGRLDWVEAKRLALRVVDAFQRTVRLVVHLVRASEQILLAMVVKASF